MVYEIMKCGKRIRISKNRYIYLRRKKKDIEHLEFIGGIRLKDLKKEPDENIKADDRLNAGWAEYPLLPEESCSGRICGYITVKTAEGKEAGYVAIYSKHKLPLALFTALYGIYFAVPLTALAVVSLTYLIVSNRPRDMPEEKASEIPVAEDVTEYDDSPVSIEADTAADEISADGNVSFNAYSGDYNVAEGDSIPLNNISSNDVYLRYLLETSSGQKIYTSDLIAPGSQIEFTPSNYLQRGRTDVKMYVECYALDKETKYPGSCMFDISIVYQ